MPGKLMELDKKMIKRSKTIKNLIMKDNCKEETDKLEEKNSNENEKENKKMRKVINRIFQEIHIKYLGFFKF